MPEPTMSSRPEGSIDPDEWSESDMICEVCGTYMWARGWWDDPAEHGGACIGTWFECGGCGDYDHW